MFGLMKGKYWDGKDTNKFMKILPELIPLVKEHHQSLSLANRAIKTAQANVEEDVAALCMEIQETFEASFKAHFLTEEETVFIPLIQQNESLSLLCTQLIEEHKVLQDIAINLTDYPDSLLEFGKLLKSHTRLEDRELFSHVSDLSDEQRQEILQRSKTH